MITGGRCFLGTAFLLAAAGGILAASTAAAQAPWAVRGRVTTAETGAGMAGASVVVKGTSTGTRTDASGDYTLDARSPTDTLVFSLIGRHKQEVAIAGREVVDVVLAAAAIALPELVVVGYSTTAARELAGSVAQVDASELEGVTTEDLSTMLQGKAAGVLVTESSGEPGTSPAVRIRGTGSITAGAEPLYVVDGVIADAGVARSVPAGDVASVTVLKDAAATALYGSRAANGVIVVTTKAGQAGATQVNISSSVGFNEPIFGKFSLMNSRQLYELDQAMGAPNLTEDVLSRNTDWRDLAFRRSRTGDVNVSVTGGDDRTRFYVSGGYYTEEGTLLSTAYDRISGRINFEHTVNDRLRLAARAFGRYDTRLRNPTAALYQAYTNLPWDIPYHDDGTPKTGREPEWRGRESSNFLYSLQYNWSRQRGQSYGLDIKLDYDLAPWLSVSTTNRAEFEHDRDESYDDPRTAEGNATGGNLYNRYAFDRSILTSNLLRLTKSLGDHRLGGLLGYEYQRSYADSIGGTGTGIFSGLETLDVTAEALALGGNKDKSAFLSTFLKADYDYRGKYFATLSFRRDGSSRFGVDNRYGNFYSIGGAWMISDEAFLRGVSAVDHLKLRASYGTTGNAAIGNFLAQDLYTYSVQYDGLPGSLPERLGNPNLTWEVAHSLNIGVDVGLFNRVALALDVYRRVNENLLQDVEVPKTSGFAHRTLNVGAVENRGIELELSTVNLRGDVLWTTDFNIARNRTKVLELYEHDPIISTATEHQRIIEGRDLRTWYLRKWLGVDPADGDPLWEKIVYDANGRIIAREATSNYSEATLQPMGIATPDFTGGFRSTFRYRGFELSGFFTFVLGNQLYHSARELFDADGAYYTYNNMVLQDGWSRWQKPGDRATHPKPIPGGNQNSQKPSSRFLEDGSYLRLRNLTLACDLPGSLVPGLNVRSARVFVSGDNLLTLTRFSGMDPEAGFSGIVSTKYPIGKKVLLGIRVGL
jgi:TonB-linked SusC/RagA family outer membrane protein